MDTHKLGEKSTWERDGCETTKNNVTRYVNLKLKNEKILNIGVTERRKC